MFPRQCTQLERAILDFGAYLMRYRTNRPERGRDIQRYLQRRPPGTIELVKQAETALNRIRETVNLAALRTLVRIQPPPPFRLSDTSLQARLRLGPANNSARLTSYFLI